MTTELVVDTKEIALRIGAALVAGSILGINRDLHHKSAGLRTHAIVSIGSALVVTLSFAVSGDGATRVMQGLVTGIGFLGAGVILHRETQKRIEGLTTAASIWVAAGFGMACGMGLFVLAGIALAATMLVLIVGGPIERVLERRFGTVEEEEIGRTNLPDDTGAMKNDTRLP